MKFVVMTDMEIIIEITLSKSGLPVVKPAITKTETITSNKPVNTGPP